MALKYFDGFDHYAPAGSLVDVLHTGIGNAFRYVQAQAVAPGQPGRVPGTNSYSVAIMESSTAGYLQCDSVEDFSTAIVGFGLKLGVGFGSDNNVQPLYITLGDNTETVGSSDYWGSVPRGQVTVTINTDGSISIYTGSAPNAHQNTPVTPTTFALIGHIPNVINPFVWNFIEIKCVLKNDTTGSISVRINSKTVLSLTGVQTATSGNDWTNSLSWGSIASSNSYIPLIDDFYWCDSSTGPNPTYPNNDFLGELQVLTGYPIANGPTIEWTTGTTAVPNYENVNAVQNNEGATYNYTSTAGQTDDFTMTPLPSQVDAVIAVEVVGSYTRTGTDARELSHYIKSSGTIAGGGTYAQTQNTYQYFSDVFEVDPATGIAWTIASTDTLVVGYSLVS